MRPLPLSENDYELFESTITKGMLQFMLRHRDAFHQMFREQGKAFWIDFLIKFRGYSTKYGYIKSFKRDKVFLDDFFDDAFNYFHEIVLEGTADERKNFVLYSPMLVTSWEVLFKCDQGRRRENLAKDPFYNQETREAYRTLFGKPSRLAYQKAEILIPLYVQFSAAMCIAFHRWLEADTGHHQMSNTPIHYQEFHRICTDCLLFTVTKFCQEKLHGARTGPILLPYWNKQDPRFEDPNNPLYDPRASVDAVWHENLTLIDWAKFVQYLRYKECPCYTSLMGFLPLSGPGYEKEHKKLVEKYETVIQRYHDFVREMITPTVYMKSVLKKEFSGVRMIVVHHNYAYYAVAVIISGPTPTLNWSDGFTLSKNVLDHKFNGLAVQVTCGKYQWYSGDAGSVGYYINAKIKVHDALGYEAFQVRIASLDEKRLTWLMMCVLHFTAAMVDVVPLSFPDAIFWIHHLTPDLWANTCIHIECGLSPSDVVYDGDLLGPSLKFDSLKHSFIAKPMNIDYMNIKEIEMTSLIPFMKACGFSVAENITCNDLLYDGVSRRHDRCKKNISDIFTSSEFERLGSAFEAGTSDENCSKFEMINTFERLDIGKECMAFRDGENAVEPKSLRKGDIYHLHKELEGNLGKMEISNSLTAMTTALESSTYSGDDGDSAKMPNGVINNKKDLEGPVTEKGDSKKENSGKENEAVGKGDAGKKQKARKVTFSDVINENRSNDGAKAEGRVQGLDKSKKSSRKKGKKTMGSKPIADGVKNHSTAKPVKDDGDRNGGKSANVKNEINGREEVDVKFVGAKVQNKVLKFCSHCAMQENVARSFKKCQKCVETGVTNIKYYCGKECQVLDWKAGHSREH